jgi:hypothetical protein
MQCKSSKIKAQYNINVLEYLSDNKATVIGNIFQSLVPFQLLSLLPLMFNNMQSSYSIIKEVANF